MTANDLPEHSSRGEAMLRFIDRFGDEPSLATALTQWQAGKQQASADLYYRCIALLERKIWSDKPDPAPLALYQSLFRELEGVLGRQHHEHRHDFLVVIPVADRPQQLRVCLDTLFELCRCFNYGGLSAGSFRKVSVLIADDSKEGENIERIREIAAGFDRRGLPTTYFGQNEQLETIDRYLGANRKRLAGVLGETDHAAFCHKGASLMRNITYLKLREVAATGGKWLFFFVDSDQEFRVALKTKKGDRKLCAINYFYYLNRIFSTTSATVLTGKVVGDPPVSPAVMAGRLLEDITRFLQHMRRVEPDQACCFHGNTGDRQSDASYHDMAELFGFNSVSETPQYHCQINGTHTHAATFSAFSRQLDRFFDGGHPTRRSYYQYTAAMASLTPARTVYTGNYVLTPEALHFFIPFASLKLRMAGPVLGRLIRSASGEHFLSANLPLLHQRTVAATGTSEFRSGIDRRSDTVNLAGEYERQFFGDVMLFSMERLIDLGYPGTSLSADEILAEVVLVEQQLSRKYRENHQRTRENMQRLLSLLDQPADWWSQRPELAADIASFRRFARNIDHNFGPEAEGFRLIGDRVHKQRRIAEITRAIARYPADKVAWQDLLEGVSP